MTQVEILKDNEFKCTLCKQIFEKILTDEEEKKQFIEEFPNDCWNKENSLACDDCYKKMFPKEDLK